MNRQRSIKKYFWRHFSTGLFFIIVGLFLYIKPGLALTGDYNKATNGNLSNWDWNNLPNDFVTQNSLASSQYWTLSGSILTATSSALNVGIGTTAPGSFKLAVAGPFSADNGNFISDGSGNLTYSSFLDNANPLYKLDPSNTGVSLNVAGTVAGSNLAMSGTGNSYVMGNLGVGTTNLNNKLDIHKAFSASGLYEGPDFNFSTDNGSASWSTGQIVGYVAAGSGNSVVGYPGGLLFKTKNADGNATTTPTIKMVLDAQGNVGIGTTNPSSKLEVKDGVITQSGITSAYNSFNKELRIDVGGGSNNGLYLNGDMRFGPDYGGPRTGLFKYNTTIDGLIIDTWGSGKSVRIGGSSVILGVGEGGQLGNVGIGTISPAYTLDVNGAGNFNNNQIHNVGAPTVATDAANKSYVDSIIIPSSTVPIGTQSGFWTTGASSSIYNNNTGNVGIGTTNPQQKLDISGNITTYGKSPATFFPNGAFVAYNPTGDVNQGSGMSVLVKESSFGGFSIGYETTAPNKWLLGISNGMGDRTGLSFFEDSQAAKPRLTIATGGNVGIGTANPTRKLEVVTGAGQTGLYVENMGNSTYPTAAFRNNQDSSYASIDVYGGSAITDSTKFQFGQYATGDSFFYLFGNNNLDFFTSATNRMRITGSGNVGIGTTTPAVKLDVSGGTGNVLNMEGGFVYGLNSTPVNNDQAVPLGYLKSNYAPLGSGTGSAFVQGGNSFGAAATLGTNDNYPLNFETNNTTQMTVLANGNVGIGTTNPAYRLDISPSSQNAWVNVAGYGGSTGLILKTLSGTNPGVATIYTSNNENFGGNKLFIGNSLQSPLVTFTTDTGNVGIGTTNPAARLNVYGGDVRISSASNGYWWLGSDNSGAYIENVGNNTSNENIRFQSSKLGNLSDYSQFVIDPTSGFLFTTIGTGNGNVGIGTTTPAVKLDVNGGTGNALNMEGGFVYGLNSTPVNNDQAVPLGYLKSNYAPLGSGTGSAFVQGGNSFGAAAILGTNDNYPLNFETNNTTQMTVLANGNVGIGTTNPTAALSLNGGLTLKHTSVSDANYTVSGSDYIIGYTSLTASRTVTVPNALCTPGRFFVIVDESGNASLTNQIIIDPEGTTPIIGQQTFALQNPYNSVYIFCGNSAWYVL